MHGASGAVSFQASAGRGRHCVHGSAVLLGQDILIAIWGGTGPHIGSISITMPRPGRTNPGAVSTTSCVHNFAGHKDEAVARRCAERIAAACNKKTVAVAGIHIDEANADDIGRILHNVDTLCGRLIRQLCGAP